MKLRLHSIEHAPKALPIWQAILDDLGDPPTHRIARTLGVSIRTVYRWNAAQEAPRCAAMALFWLTKWGQSHVNAQAVNDAAMACGYVSALRRELEDARRELAYVSRLTNGAGNDPLIRGPL
jgi:hypothetical protein